MKILFQRPLSNVQVSIVLLDWSCRESFHIFDYLDKQTVARERYELIWLEYFDTRPEEIARRIEAGTACPDLWGVLEMPQSACYHKHFIYNAGILLARGRIVVICDSDAMVNPTFVESILAKFSRTENIVLHLDEVRNIDRHHYPFDYPTISEFLAGTCINWRNGLTRGLLADADKIHDPNYGACFCALREDVIAIGGADEHIDYLGHVCGPYDMTFRLINYGRREIWLKDEYLYHTWHPGTDGENNYLGPHDGRNVSSRSLNARFTGRVKPYLESSAIAHYRQTRDLEESLDLLSAAAEEHTAGDWLMDDVKRFLSMGREAWYRGRFTEAVACWERLAMVPETRTSEVLGWLGWGLASQKRLEESVPAFQEALILDKANAWAQCGLGRSLSLLSRTEEAMDIFNNLLNRSPEDYLAQRIAVEERGNLLFGKGDFAAARSDFSILCLLCENEDKTLRQKAFYRLGVCELRLGQDDAAAAAFGKTGFGSSGNPHLTRRYMEIHFLLRDCRTRLLHLLRYVKHTFLKRLS